MFAGSYRRVPHHSFGRRSAGNRPLINFLFVLVALAIIYVCCVLVSLVRSQKRRHATSHSTSHSRANQRQSRGDSDLVDSRYLTHLDPDEDPGLLAGDESNEEEPDDTPDEEPEEEPDEEPDEERDEDPDIEQDTFQDEDQTDDEVIEDSQYDHPTRQDIRSPDLDSVPIDPAGAVPDKSLKSPDNPKGLPYPPEVINPNRSRAQTLQYGVCSASAYSVPDFGPLYLLDRGQESSCAVYLYPAIYGLSRPILPKLPPRPAQQAPPAANPAARRRLHGYGPASSSARQLLARPLPPRTVAPGPRDDSDVAVGVLAAVVNFAAEEQLTTATELQQIAGLRTPRSASTLPPDIGHWTHVQLQKARMLHEAWRANATDVEQRLPHSVALLRHPTRAALAREFARASACLLRHQGGPGAAALQGAGDLDTLAASVLTWPQVMSYDTPERMPTGRETSLPRTVMRGVFIAREVGSVMIDTYDPRGPLDSMEIQDTVNDMYKIELNTGALMIFPSWVQTSILILPPERPSAGDAGRDSEQPAPTNHVAQADRAELELGFAAGFSAADAAPPPRSAAASILHLALPGDPPATASGVLPLRIETPRVAAGRRLRSEDDPDAEPDTQQDGQPDEQPHEQPDDQPDDQPDEQPEENPDTDSHVQPVVDSDAQSDAQPDLQPDAQPTTQLDAQPDTHPDDPAPPPEHATDTAVGGSPQAPPAPLDLGACDTFEHLWYMYGSPVSVHNLEAVDPELDLVKLRDLALAAFEAFRRCFPEDGNDAEHGYPGSLGDDLFAYQSHWPNTRDYPCAGGLEGAAAVEREEEWQRAFATYVMGAMHQRMLTAVSTVVTSLLQGLGKASMVEQSPGMFSWLTVHDESTSFHGRHYHRDQGMTAVLYISDPAPDTAPLEFSNPVVGPDTAPNGRVTFMPRRGDFVIFPSFLSHTVPMRHLQRDAPPRISIAFNIWFRGEGLNRYAEGMPEEDRDEVGHHQYVTLSDVVLDRHFRPAQGMPFAQPSLQ